MEIGFVSSEKKTLRYRRANLVASEINMVGNILGGVNIGGNI